MTRLQKIITIHHLRAATRDLQRAFVADPDPHLIFAMTAVAEELSRIESVEPEGEERHSTPRRRPRSAV